MDTLLGTVFPRLLDNLITIGRLAAAAATHCSLAYTITRHHLRSSRRGSIISGSPPFVTPFSNFKLELRDVVFSFVVLASKYREEGEEEGDLD